MVESHQLPHSTRLWRYAFEIKKNNQLSTIRYQLLRRFPDIYIQEVFYDSRFTHYDSRVGFPTSRLRFVLRSFVSSVDWNRGQRPRLQRNRKVNDQAERVISTPELNMLPCLHPEPINVVVYHDPSGRTHLGIGLALRCFQRLSLPNIATQHCR